MKEDISPIPGRAPLESLTQVGFDVLIAVASARQAATPTVHALQRRPVPHTLAEAASARRTALASGDMATGAEVAGAFGMGQSDPKMTGFMQDFVALADESVDERRINHSASIDIELRQDKRRARAAGRNNRGQVMDRR